MATAFCHRRRGLPGRRRRPARRALPGRGRAPCGTAASTRRILVLGPVDRAEAAVAADLDVRDHRGLPGRLAARRGGGRRARCGCTSRWRPVSTVRAWWRRSWRRRWPCCRRPRACALVGLSSHFADIEDTTDHAFADAQMARFAAYRRSCWRARASTTWPIHMSCSAAVLLWDRSHRGHRAGGHRRPTASGPRGRPWSSVRQRGRDELELRAGPDLEGARVPGARRCPRARPSATAAPGRP